MSRELPPISVGVINFNGLKVIENTLTSLFQSDYPDFEVIVVDDASTDESVSLIREKFPEAKVFTQPVNMGLNAGRNRALLEAKHDFAFIVDNDATFAHDTLKLLANAMAQDSSIAVATPMVVDSVDHEKIYSNLVSLHYTCYGIIPLRHEKIPVNLDLSPKISVCGSGGFMLLRKSAVIDLGMFDEDLRFGFDEGEFTYRATACGWKVVQVPEARVYHIENSVRSRDKIRFPIRNRWDFLLKVYATRTLVMIFPALLLSEAANLGFVIVKGAFGEWLTGMGMVAKSFGKIKEKRKAFQLKKKRPDKELLVAGEIFIFPSKLGKKGMVIAKNIFEAILNGYWQIVRPFLAK